MANNQIPSPPTVPQPLTTPSVTPQNAPSLDNVEGGYGAYMRKKWWVILITVLLAGGLFFINPVFGIAVVLVALTIMKYFYENALFSAFASTNHFTYQKKGNLDDQTGLLFSIGHSRKFRDIVMGTYRQWPLQLFLYIYTIGYGRDSRTYHRAVVSINFGVAAPAFILRRHKLFQLLEEEGESLRSGGYTQKVNLEGDFNKHFQVYIQPNSQIDVLSILTPDVMQLLMGLDRYEVEMTQTGVFNVYCHDYLTKKQDLMDIYTIIEAVIPKIGTDVRRSNELRTLSQPVVVTSGEAVAADNKALL